MRPVTHGAVDRAAKRTDDAAGVLSERPDFGYVYFDREGGACVTVSPGKRVIFEGPADEFWNSFSWEESAGGLPHFLLYASFPDDEDFDE